MNRLMIIIGDANQAAALLLKMKKCFEGKAVMPSENLIEAVCGFQPDYLILDLALPGWDGIAVLRTLNALGIRPAVLVVAHFLSYYQQFLLEQLGVVHFMFSPWDVDIAANRLSEMAGLPFSDSFPIPDRRKVVSNMLCALGLNSNHMGFDCLVEAIPVMQDSPGIFLTKELYPAIAKIIGSSSKQVERGIRSAIVAAWEKMDIRIWQLFFTIDENGKIPQPTNAEFIQMLVYLLEKHKENGVHG